MSKRPKVEPANQDRPGLTALTDAELETVGAASTSSWFNHWEPAPLRSSTPQAFRW